MAITFTNDTITVIGVHTINDIFTEDSTNSWGVVSKQGTSYYISANLDIGDGTTSTTLSGDSLHLQIGAETLEKDWTVNANAEFILENFGFIDHSGTNYNDCFGVVTFRNGTWVGNGNSNIWTHADYTLDAVRLKNLRFVQQSTGYVNRVTSDNVSFYVFTDTTSFSDLVLGHSIYVDDGKNPTISNSTINNWQVCSFWLPYDTSFCDVKFVDCDVESWNAGCGGSDNSDYILRQQQTVKTIITSDNNLIDQANVAMFDINGSEEFSVTTDEYGTFSEEIITQATYNRLGADTPLMYTPHIYRVRKYGYKYIEASKNITDRLREGTIVEVNNVITEQDLDIVKNYSGINVYTSNKIVAVSEAMEKSKLYDFLQYYSLENMNQPEVLSSIIGQTYTIADGWNIYMFDEISDDLTISGDLYVVNGATLNNCTIFGNLHIKTGVSLEETISSNAVEQDLTLDFSNVIVHGLVYNDSANNTLTINASNSSLIAESSGTANGETNIVQSATLTISGLMEGSEVRLYDSLLNEISGVENSLTTESFSYSEAYVGAILVVHHISYAPLRIELDLEMSNSTLPIQQVYDRNYSNN